MTSTLSLSILGLAVETWASLPGEVVTELVPPGAADHGDADERAVSEKQVAVELA